MPPSLPTSSTAESAAYASGLAWKPDWDTARRRIADAWRGFALWLDAPKDQRWEDIPAPPPPATLAQRWLDPAYRIAQAEHRISRTLFAAEAFPCFEPHVGPGNLATFLGSEPCFTPDSVWFDACITDADAWGKLSFDEAHPRYREQVAIVEAGVRHSRERYLVAMPDLVEGLDVLASLRGNEALMMDLVERPAWVGSRVREINQVWRAAYDNIEPRVRDRWGGSCWTAFGVWAPGRLAKLQCDAAGMIAPEAFRAFAVPSLTEQCGWVDYRLYHLDGTQALCHLDTLLEMEGLDVIQWTPQAGLEGGGAKRWFDLYRRIRAAGKGVQAVHARPDEVVPLLEAVGPDGLFIMAHAATEEEAHRLVEAVEPYRPSM